MGHRFELLPVAYFTNANSGEGQWIAKHYPDDPYRVPLTHRVESSESTLLNPGGSRAGRQCSELCKVVFWGVYPEVGC